MLSISIFKRFALSVSVALLFCGCKKTAVNTAPGYSLQPGNLRIQGAPCPYDESTGTYYFPVAIGSSLADFSVSFDTSIVKTLLFDDQPATGQSTVHKKLVCNQMVKLTASDKSGITKTYSLMITGLPLIAIGTDSLAGDGIYSQTAYSLIDPDYLTKGGSFVVEGKMRIKLRGHTAMRFPKKAYAMKIEDDSQADLDVPLLGLRSDNSWILDAMYVDQGRMRNRLATDIWNSMNNVPYAGQEPAALNGTRGYFVEMVINNQYNGLYCMTEDMDRKQLQLKKSYGNMYKSDSAGPTTEFTGTLPYDNSSEGWGQWELTYPDFDDDRVPDWSYLYKLVDFVANSDDKTFVDSIAMKADLKNLEDYLIFINTVGATDNIGKNLYCSFYDYRKAPAFFLTVWDLDASFGRDWRGTPVPATALAFQGTESRLFSRLLALDPNNFVAEMQARFNELKTGQLSLSTVDARIGSYGDLLLNSGAWDREKKRWTAIPPTIQQEVLFMQKAYARSFSEAQAYILGR